MVTKRMRKTKTKKNKTKGGINVNKKEEENRNNWKTYWRGPNFSIYQPDYDYPGFLRKLKGDKPVPNTQNYKNLTRYNPPPAGHTWVGDEVFVG